MVYHHPHVSVGHLLAEYVVRIVCKDHIDLCSVCTEFSELMDLTLRPMDFLDRKIASLEESVVLLSEEARSSAEEVAGGMASEEESEYSDMLQVCFCLLFSYCACQLCPFLYLHPSTWFSAASFPSLFFRAPCCF